MYSTCLFCNRPLGSNEVVERFPVGRRLAFDSSKGRLWVVCRSCERWNLSPLEERWEAIEDCERLFHGTRMRTSTDNIGLARLREGLELVRIGQPMRPEFAAWRYGDQFGRRRRKAILWGVAGVTAIGALAAGSIAVGAGVPVVGQLPNIIINTKTRAKIKTSDGRKLVVKQPGLQKTRLARGEGPDDWELSLRHTRGTEVFTGQEALRVAGIIMPAVNRSGGSASNVQTAVRRIEEAGNPEAYLQQATHSDSWKQVTGNVPFSSKGIGQPLAVTRLAAPTKLAVEMALHEEQERKALEGELALLEDAWKEAEQIAAIADDLLLPEGTDEALRNLKESSTGTPSDGRG
jgi:hypothetical protein